MTQYSEEFKNKIVLEVLKADKTINEIASEYNIIPKNIQNWKNIFLANAVVAMEPAKAVKEYKDEIEKLKAKNDEYAKIVGKLTVENSSVLLVRVEVENQHFYQFYQHFHKALNLCE